MMDVSQLTPRRPYLLRAFYEWLLDNQLTPHLVVDVTLPGVMVPMEYARDGQIVLNIAPRAVGNLELAFKTGITGINDVEQQGSIQRLVERRFERGNQTVRQIFDKADGIADQHARHTLRMQSADSRIKRRK